MGGALLFLAIVAGCGGAHGGGSGGGGGTSGENGGHPSTGGGGSTAQNTPPEIDGRIRINELMASNALTLPAESGAAGDWIELFNPTSVDIPLGGYALTDDLATPMKAVVPPNVVLTASGHLVLWLDGKAAAGPTHFALTLPRGGGTLALARPDGSIIDHLVYGAQETDLSAAREPDGADRWAIEWRASPGAANPPGGPVGSVDPQPGAGGGTPAQVPAAGDVSERIYGYDAIPAFAITVTAEAANSLVVAPTKLVPAMLEFEGRSYGPVGLRLKGMNSFEPFDKKPSLRIKVDEYADGAVFFGLKDLTLNNMHSDYSMMHERLSYWLARKLGVPASRSNHAMVTVNGTLYGLYANVETVRKRMVARWFSDDTGPLFEATDVDFVPGLVAGYHLETGPDDRSMLEGAAAALAGASSADAAIAAAGAYIDIVAFQKFWAYCAVAGQLDSFPYSDPGDDYFIYADPASDRIAFIPWGMDETFYAPLFDITKVKSALAVACQRSATCYQGFVDRAWDALATFESLDWLGEARRIEAQIAPYVAMDTRKWYTNEDVVLYQGYVRQFLQLRRGFMGEKLPPRSR